MADHIPKGFVALTPFVHVSDGAKFVAWAKAALGATERMMHRQDGHLVHGEIVIEGCVLELTDASDEWPAQKASFHLYVEDADAVYANAIEHGATSLYAVTDHEYGERSGGVKDPFGNHWYIATVTNHEARTTVPS